MPAGNAKFLLDSVFELAARINRFRLSDAEIGLFCAVVIITAGMSIGKTFIRPSVTVLLSDRPGLRNPELVGKMQEKLKSVLKNILAPQHPEHNSIFRELLTIVHDLRTLNTLHTEKFLQQSRVEGAPSGMLPPHLLYASSSSGADWEEQADQDSTGSRSPQSSDCGLPTQHSSWEDMRRSPIGSVSSSESLGSETGQTFSRLSVNDLKIHGVGSVLLNALTSPAVSTGATCPPTRKRDISRCGSEGNLLHHRPETEANTSPSTDAAKCPFKARKLESPSDSGIDSPKAQGSQSTNTSVCSSPRSSLEEKVKEVEEEQAKQPEVRGDSLEEQHPLLKRALQQPPQPYNAGGVTGFQDEVYKPHKKFRHSGRKDSDEPTSTQESATSPIPSSESSSQAASHSILASQLAAPPTYSALGQQSSASQSLLASTLSRPIAVPRAKEAEKRNEWLANLILEKGRPTSPSASNQSLLMCAPMPAHSSHIPGSFDSPWAAGQASAGSSASTSGPSTPRHIPVPVAPTPSSSSTSRIGAGQNQAKSEAAKNPHLKMALSGLPPTYEAPLNLSTKSGSPTDIPAEA